MHMHTAPGSALASRIAYLSAAIFTSASTVTNLAYGWQKGIDWPSSFTWAAVSAGVAIIFALSWPALIRSADARQWSAVVIALAALVLSGSYSITAALGSAAGGRMNAAATETDSTDARKKAQGAYGRAEADLAKLAPSRPAGEIEALLLNAQWWKPPRGCTADKIAQRVTCPAWEAELARARERTRLEASMASATETLNKTQARVANTDAKALQRYLSAIGIEIGADRLNDLLTLLSVVMIEAGGGLSLALGLALTPSRPPASASEAPASEASKTPDVAQTASADARETLKPIVVNASCTPAASVPIVLDTDILAPVRAAGGSLCTTMRRLGAQVGRPSASVHTELRRLASGGLITLSSDSRGTVIALRTN